MKLSGYQRLMGATLLVFLNKTDVEHCMGEDEVREVCAAPWVFGVMVIGFYYFSSKS